LIAHTLRIQYKITKELTKRD